MSVNKIKIQFSEDTVVDVQGIGRAHIGMLQHRPNDGKENPAIRGKMETYFPKGTVLEVLDFASCSTAVNITATSTPQQGTILAADDDPENPVNAKAVTQ